MGKILIYPGLLKGLIYIIVFSGFLGLTASAYNVEGGGVCNCSICDECGARLSDPSCSVVKLTADINDYSGTCINDPTNFVNKTFDCQGYAIDGDDSGTDYGLYLSGKSNNTIRNCVITDFYYGIHLYSSSNYNTITNNTANSNSYGIVLSSSSSNTLTNNTASSNTDGFLLSSSLRNTLINNIVNSNTYAGISLASSSNNTLTSNTANSNAQYGILLLSSSNNTLTSNTANSNAQYGIYLYSSSSNTITNDIVNSNTESGIYLQYSSNNTLTSNTANSNTQHGIYLESANYITLTSNTANSNKYGIRFYSSFNNTLTNNIVNSNTLYGIYSYGSTDGISSNNVCGNVNSDFLSYDWLSSSGDENTCNIPDGWNDAGTTGCTYVCPAGTTTTTTSTTTTTTTTSSTTTTSTTSPTSTSTTTSTTTTTLSTTTSTTTTSTSSTSTTTVSTTTSTTSTSTTTTTTTTSTTSTTTTTITTPRILINEFLPYPRGNNPEWIELYNKEDYSVNLSGWRLDDMADGGSNPYTILNDGVITAGGFKVFYGSVTGIVLGDMGDTVRLLYSNDQSIDSYSYSYSQRGVSIGRLTDGGNEWTNFDVPTPGISNEVGLNDNSPPVVTLVFPSNEAINRDGNVIFKYIPNDWSPISNCMLYTNVTGIWQISRIDTTVLANSPNSFGLFGLSSGTYLWNVRCTDEMSLSAFAPQSFTFVVNITTNETVYMPLNITVNQTVNITSKASKITIEINVTENISNVNVVISSFYNNTHNASLSVPGLDKYVSIISSSELEDSLNLISLKMYYTESELIANNLTEDDLGIWWFNDIENKWQLLNPDTMDWVRATGVNKGENYVWANVEHFSDYTIAQGTAPSFCLLKGDTDCDAMVSDFELLGYINEWVKGLVEDFDLLTAIDNWAKS